MDNMGKLARPIVLIGMILFFTVSAFTQEALDVELPPPPESQPLGKGSEKITIRDRELDCSYYLSSRTKDATTVFYQRFFRDQGFKNTIDNSRGEDFKGRELRSIIGKEAAEYFDSVGLKEKLDIKIVSVRQLRFNKEDRARNQELVVELIISEKPDGTHVSIAKYLKPLGSPDIFAGPPSIKEIEQYVHKEDAPGRDLKAIPRPPDSTRWGSLELGGRAVLAYASKLPVDELKEFYKNQMSYQGWQIVGEAAAGQALDRYKNETRQKDIKMGSLFSDAGDLSGIISEAHILEFKGKEGRATITIMPNFMDKKLGSVAQIDYEQPS